MIALWLVLAAFAEGTDELGATQRLGPATLLKVDILSPGERAVWTAAVIDGLGRDTPVDVEVEAPDGSDLGVYSSGEVLPYVGTGTYLLRPVGVDAYGPPALEDDPADSGPPDGVIDPITEFDVTVSGSPAGEGRLWSSRWRFDTGFFREAYALTGSVFVLADGGGPGRDTVIELAADGLAGNEYVLHANAVGATLDADPAITADGHSVPQSDWTLRDGLPIYLNPPSVASYNPVVPRVSAAMPSCEAIAPGVASGGVSFESDVSGVAHVICDANGDGVLDPTSPEDVHVLGPAVDGLNLLPVSGFTPDGSPYPVGDHQCVVRLTTGEVHYAAEDIETSFEGVRLFRVAADGSRLGIPMFFDDSLVQDAAVVMPDDGTSAERSGPLGLDSGVHADAAVPNVNARAWGNWTSRSKGQASYLDTWTFVHSDDSVPFDLVIVPPELDSDRDGVGDAEEACIHGSDRFSSDTDRDGVPDGVEILLAGSDPTSVDSDGDGVPDPFEIGDLEAPRDTDGDGLSDAADDDDDGDGLPTRDEDPDGDGDPTNDDSDGDGLPDHRDADDDGDGLLTALEDVDGDGDVRNDRSDGDGLPDYRDPDDDGDGMPTAIEDIDGDGVWDDDADGDGLPNHLDRNDDNDGIPAANEDPLGAGIDTDLDGVPDFADADDDGDGVPSADEGTGDVDGDGRRDFQDADDDDDGVPGIDEDHDGDGDPRTDDTDGDGVADWLDPDDDDDGIPTLREDPDRDGTPCCDDPDGDGLLSYLDPDDDGDHVLSALEDHDGDGDPSTDDTDGDGQPDPYDVDDDGDGILTVDEDPNGDGDPSNDDTDRDGMPDHADADDDGDGLPTIREVGDTDGDGVPDYRDSDDDGDGIPTAVEDRDGNGNPLDDDSDGDGRPDFADTDDDGDGVPSLLEGNGDTDGDGIPDALDLDSDGDGVGDGEEGTGDLDRDGVPDFQDADDDGDGLLSIDEGDVDHDGDGLPDRLDADDDGDGVPTAVEGAGDPDGDGVPSHLDDDSDGDGISDAVEGADDVDGDGVPNVLDIDADGDGAPDAVEGTVDSDGDGLADFVDTDDDGDGVPTLDEPGDTDGDRTPDRLDLDDDGDSVLTAREWADSKIVGPDPDGDGLPSWRDTDADGDGVPDGDELSDIDGDGLVDYLDPDGTWKPAYRGSGAFGCSVGGGAALGWAPLAWLFALVRRRRLGVALLLGSSAAASAQESTVSRSAGHRDGIVVLWPRVVPPTDDAAILSLARSLQTRLSNVAATAVADRKRLDVRPPSERACPKKGCKGISVGLVLGHAGTGCAAVVTISAPGESPQKLVPWAGEVTLDAPTAPFRRAPEDLVVVRELVPCDTLRREVRNELVELAIRQAKE